MVEGEADTSDSSGGASVGVSWQDDSGNRNNSHQSTRSRHAESIISKSRSSTTSSDEDDDAMTESWPLDFWADLSLPHIDSDVSDSDECCFYSSENRRRPVKQDYNKNQSGVTKPIIVNQGA